MSIPRKTRLGRLARYEGPVDTQASFNLTLLTSKSIRPLLGLSLNLPTGNSYLPGNQRFTRMDPDLVDVGSYGAGFNVNPTAGFIIGLNETTAVSLSAGYTWQGDFTKKASTSPGSPTRAPPPDFIEVDTFDLKQKGQAWQHLYGQRQYQQYLWQSRPDRLVRLYGRFARLYRRHGYRQGRRQIHRKRHRQLPD